MNFSDLTNVTTIEGTVFAGIVATVICAIVGFVLKKVYRGNKDSQSPNVDKSIRINNKGDKNEFNINTDKDKK